jgi:hypothetical protein
VDPSLLAKWFAEVDQLKPGEDFRFDFGDGDFFSGSVADWEEPTFLRLKWRFWDLGTEYEIGFSLIPLDSQTEISVQDCGALTVDEAQGLREGWEDFLLRLDRFLRSGEPSRYEWNYEIGTAIVLTDLELSLHPLLLDLDWWKTAFPGVKMSSPAKTATEITLRFNEEDWRGQETEATVTLHKIGQRTYVAFTHKGWVKLPPDKQLAERKRFAGYWAKALRWLEQNYRSY